jgi:nucleotidyltransferase/DNA polymerase involved in DNA repair
VDLEHTKDFLATLEVSKISGIGKKTEQKLNELGIRTIGELAAYPPKSLYDHFGKIGVWLWAIANAEEKVEVEENLVMKSIGAEHTFEVDEENWSAIDGQMLTLVDSIHRRLLEEKMTYRTVTLKIRFTGFETYTRATTKRFSTSSKGEIVRSIRELSVEFKQYPKRVRLMGVRISGLEKGLGKEAPTMTLESFSQ